MATIIKKSGKESKVSKCIKAPIKMLRKVKDFYIRGLSELDHCEHVTFGAVPMGCPTGAMPRSFSVGSGEKSRNADEDYRELVRAASARSSSNLMVRRNKIEEETEFFQRKQGLDREKSAAAPAKVPRSGSVGIGRIDEDYSCHFDDGGDDGDDDGDEYFNAKKDVFPRSRSAYAVSTR